MKNKKKKLTEKSNFFNNDDKIYQVFEHAEVNEVGCQKMLFNRVDRVTHMPMQKVEFFP